MPATEVILNENIPGLGAEADRVKVKAGYARNFLLPQKKALLVTPSNLRKLDHLRAKRAEREARELNEAQALSKRIRKLKLEFLLETGKEGKAFGSVTPRNIADRITTELGDVVIDHHKLDVKAPFKTTGSHEVSVKLHHEVQTSFKITIKSATEEAVETAETAEE